jgi:YD repeat-containing protein
MTEVAYQNQVNHIYQFDGLNRLTSLAVNKLGATAAQDATQHQYGYTLNASGHRTRIDELHSGRIIHHSFDDLYRLTSESISGGTVSGSTSYSYDKVSNRTSRTSTLAGVSNQTHTYTLNDLLTKHSYDANGSTMQSPDLVNQTGDTYDVYDFRNKLILRESDSGDRIKFIYNADGHRVEKSIESGGVLDLPIISNYLVDNNNPTG